MKTAKEWFDTMITGSPDIKEVISKIQMEAYNEALIDAAMLGKVEHVMVQSGDHPVYEYRIDKRSILRLKIEL